MMPEAAQHWGGVFGGGLMLALLVAGFVSWIFVIRNIRTQGLPSPLHVQRVSARHWMSEDLLHVGVLISAVLVLFFGMGLYLRRANVNSHVLHVTAALQNVFLQGMVLFLLYRRLRAAGSNLRVSFGVPGRMTWGSWKRIAWQILCGYVLCLPLVYLAAWLSQKLFASSGDGPIFQPVLVLLRDAATPLWFRGWIVGAAILVAPVVEEAFFRGVLLPVLVRKYSAWLAVLLGGVLFGLVHGHLPAALPLSVFGLGLGWAYLQTGNVLVPIGMHALFNGVNLLVLLISYTD